MLENMSDTSRIVERLVKKELVHKQNSAHDKRLVDVTLSEQGLRLINKIELNSSYIDSIISQLTAEEAHTLNSLLDKLREKD